MVATESTPLVPLVPNNGPLRKSDFILLLSGVWCLSFIGSLDATIVSTLVSDMGSTFLSMQLSSWIGSAYLLSLCAFTPLYGRLCNVIGRRKSIFFATIVFGAGTVCCGFAKTMSQLIMFRAIAGMGGGGMTVVGSVIISDNVSLKSRGLYQGFGNILFGLGGAIGAPLGGYLGDTIGWRAAFTIQAPFLFVAFLLLYLKIREPHSFLVAPRSGIVQKAKSIDYAGSITLVISLTCLLIGITNHTQNGYSWGDGVVMYSLIASVVFFILFLLNEIKWAVEPFMPIYMLKMRTPAFVSINNFLIAVLSFSTVYNTPLFFIATLLRSSGNTGAHFIPNSVAVAFGSIFAGWYMRETGKYWTLQATAAFGLVVSNIFLATWDASTPEWLLYVTLIPSGLGFSIVLTTTLLALFASVDTDHIPIATGVSYLFRYTGQVLGVSISATFVQGLLAKNLHTRITGEGSEKIIEKILESTEAIRSLPPDLQHAAQSSWADALRALYYVQIVIAVLLFLSTLPIQELHLPDTMSSPHKSPLRQDDEENRQGLSECSTSDSN